MLPDPRWDDLMAAWSAGLFSSKPCRCVEMIAHKGDDVEVTTGDLAADAVVSWLDGQTSTGQGSPPTFRTRLVIFPGVFDSDDLPSLPIPQDHLGKLVNDLGFPDRFFINLIAGRRVSAHITTRTTDCWYMHDWLFSAITLQRTRNNDMLSIVFSDNRRPYSNIENFTERYISSKAYQRHPLLPMLLCADATLEDYRDLVYELFTPSREDGLILDQYYGGGGPVVRGLNPAAALASIASQRAQVAASSWALKIFNANVRNLLSLHDRSDALNGTSGLMQSLSGQSGGQLPPSDSLGSMLQYLVCASGDILEKVLWTDATLQNSFLVMQIQVAQRDTEVSLRLARTSAEIAMAAKRDSSSMKVIALLTTLFLPGAFVGTLLSTPEYSDTTPGSWRYWAITVPLTATVMVMLILWMWWTRHVQSKEDADERKRQDKKQGVVP